MTKLTYGEQLKHPNWQRKRLERLQASNWACSKCGATETELHVHHERYIKGRMPWEYEDRDLTVLCHDCHDAQHGHGEARPPRALRISRGTVNLLDLALWLLMQRSDLWGTLDDKWGPALATLQTDPAVIARLQEFHQPDPTLDLARELQVVIDRMNLHAVEGELNLLFDSTELSADDKRRAADLTLEQHRLKRRLAHRAPG